MSALPADDLVVRPEHLMLALNLSGRAFLAHFIKGDIPQPDGRGLGRLKLWRISTIRAWNPTVAADIESLLALPAFAPRPQRRRNTPLLNAA